MTNQIIIDIDTEREKPIMIAKGAKYEAPKNNEEAAIMIIADIACVVDALLTMVHVADQNGYADKNIVVPKIIRELNQYLSLPSTKRDN